MVAPSCGGVRISTLGALRYPWWAVTVCLVAGLQFYPNFLYFVIILLLALFRRDLLMPGPFYGLEEPLDDGLSVLHDGQKLV